MSESRPAVTRVELDELDRKILRELEITGLVRRYVTLLDPAALGLGVSVLVQVSLDRQAEANLEAFESALELRAEAGQIHDGAAALRFLSAVLSGQRSLTP